MVSPFSSPVSTPRRKSKEDHKANPYSSSGLDKFSALLAEHEEQKRKIYAKIDPQNAPVIRFVYTNANQCVPVLIKSPKDEERKREDQETEKTIKRASSDQDFFREKGVIHESRFSAEIKRSKSEDLKQEKESRPFRLLKKKLRHKMKRPGNYVPVAVILILAFLAVFGRSVAIMCTAIGWYMVSMIKGGRSNGKIERKKTDLGKILRNESPRRTELADFKEKFPSLAAANLQRR